MAKLYFYYGAMGSSKTANALMTRFNYEEVGQKALLCKPRIDDRFGKEVVHSRIGLEYECIFIEELVKMNASEIKKYDFDVAILGCGAYGFPLAAEIKRMGKKAIHLGRATQLWFGIKGKRWNDDPLTKSLYNDAWVSPSDAEKPANADGVEGGCYW